MFDRFRLFSVAIATSLIIGLLSDVCYAAPDPGFPAFRPQAGNSPHKKISEELTPINKGIVIVDGHYLAGPYTIQHRGQFVSINGNVINCNSSLSQNVQKPKWQRQGAMGAANISKRPGMVGRGPMWRSRQPISRHSNWGSFLEVQLDNDAVIFQCVGQPAVFVPKSFSQSVFEILSSKAADDEKVHSLNGIGIACVRADQWHAVVDSFEPSTELYERIAEIALRQQTVNAELAAYISRTTTASLFSYAWIRYIAIVISMLLGAIALASLLSNRPRRHRRWRTIDNRRAPMVVRNVILLALLGLFDLICTAIAHNAGGFVELNPLCGSMLNNLVCLSIFKITLFLTACITLVSLRRYHGAQLASWWLCLICTIVAFRWLTYNSLFLA